MVNLAPLVVFPNAKKETLSPTATLGNIKEKRAITNQNNKIN